MAGNAALHFFPWVRQGAVAGIADRDNLRPDQAQANLMPVRLEVNNTPGISVNVRIYGPGEVTGMDPRQVIRTDPPARTRNFPPNYLVAVEFDRPDFPWLFTPLGPGDKDRLRPWITLIVVRRTEDVRPQQRVDLPLPELIIRDLAELPDPAESWAWAHAQVAGASGDAGETQKAALGESSARNLSRLLCPRRLDPRTDYIACLVPAFESGRQAGLGLPVTETSLRPAWSSDTASPLRLPVYYNWEFSTGETGDFETLVSALKPRALPDAVGQRWLNLDTAGQGLPPTGLTRLAFDTVLRPLRPPAADLPKTPEVSVWQEKLTGILNRPALTQETMTDADPLIAPPLYGARQAGKDRLGGAAAPWLAELNLDPRHRVAAALGTMVVQRDQEQLMAAAWEQGEVLRQANQQLLWQELAAETREATRTRHFDPLDKDAQLRILGPALGEMPAAVASTATPEEREAVRGKTLAFQLKGGTRPELGTAAMRRVARTRGALNRRFLPPGFLKETARPLIGLLKQPPPVPVVPGIQASFIISRVPYPGMVTTKMVSDGLVRQTSLPTEGETNPRWATLMLIRPEEKVVTEVYDDFSYLKYEVNATVFKTAAARHQAIVSRHPDAIVKPRIPGVHDGGIVITTGWKPGGSLGVRAARGALGTAPLPVLAHPRFPRPMYETLRDYAPEYLLAGLEQVPVDTITLVETNPAFIESFMIGLNTELARELLWREYPTDQRGTYFRHFWDTRAAAGPDPGMPPITGWAKALGANSQHSGAGQMVLLLRGELLRRYPGAIIYAVQAATGGGEPVDNPTAAQRLDPAFRGSLPPDVVFLGFPGLTVEMARGGRGSDGRDHGPGWFFVLQQQPGEPHFGLDDADPARGFGRTLKRPESWQQLSWGHLVKNAEALRALTHIRALRASGELPDTSAIRPAEKAEWGRNGAHMARITLQAPVMIAIHAAMMLSDSGARPQ